MSRYPSNLILINNSRILLIYLYPFIDFYTVYFVGLIITVIVAVYFERGQPALVFLVPCTVLPTILLTLIKGDFRVLWNSDWNLDNRQSIPREDEEMISIEHADEARSPL